MKRNGGEGCTAAPSGCQMFVSSLAQGVGADLGPALGLAAFRCHRRGYQRFLCTVKGPLKLAERQLGSGWLQPGGGWTETLHSCVL